MTLVTAGEVKLVVRTGLSDAELYEVIERVEAEIIARFGAHYASGKTVSETLEGSGYSDLFLCRQIASVSSVIEDGATLAATGYRLWAGQGRLQRLPRGATWGEVVTVAYTPADDNALRRGVIVDLVRLALERTAMRSENLGGEFQYQAPEWEAEAARILRRLRLSYGG
jgi:hypothetical protein